MALVGAAMVFALRERVEAEAANSLTSVRDVVEMISWYFLKPRTSEEVADAIEKRHEGRRRASRFKAGRRRKSHAEKVTQ